MTFKLNKGEKYIFATDLDGTFLTDFVGSMHIDSFEAAQIVKENGHHLVIATGRSWWWAENIYNQLELVDASVHFSGAQVFHPNDKTFDEFRASLSVELVKEMMNKLDIPNRSQAWQAVGRKKHGLFTKGDSVDKLNFNCYELVINYDPTEVDLEKEKDAILEIIGDKFIIRHWKMSHGFTNSSEQLIISPAGTSKAIGLKMVAEYYGVPQENVIFFGDNMNDIEALEWAGHSYAPANAKPVAKEAADEILELTNNDGAVPKKIIELVKEQIEN